MGLTEIFILLVVALVPMAVFALVVIGVVRFVVRRPSERQPWPLPEGVSPLHLHQAVASRLQSRGITPWAIEVDRSTRRVTVVLRQPASSHLDDKIRETLAPLGVDVVWHDGAFGNMSKSSEGERPS